MSEDDTYYCGVCNKFLFSDMPDDEFIMCQTCLWWYCIRCADDVGISYEKLANENYIKFFGKFIPVQCEMVQKRDWDFTVDTCPKCHNKK